MDRNKWKWKHDNPKPMRFIKSSAKRKVHSNTSLPQETRETSNNLTLHIKQLEKEEMKNPKVSRRKEIIKKNQSRNKWGKKGDYSKNQQN